MATNSGPNTGSMAKKSDAVLKLVLIFFVSLLSFAIGTFAGMKLVEQKYKLAQLEPNANHETASQESSSHESANREIASTEGSHAEAAAPTKTEKMTDEEFNKVVEEFAQDDTPDEATEQTAHNEKSAHEQKVEHKEPAVEHKAPVVEHKAAPAVDHKEVAKQEVNKDVEKNRKPTSIPKGVGQYQAAKFTVQIVALPSEEAAQKKASEYKSKGYLAFYYPAQVKGQTWYRVNVGMFATEAEAKAYRKDFMAKSKTESAIIQKISE